MVVVGFWVAVAMARFDTSQLHRANRDAFLIVPLFDIVAFAICFGLAILWRENPERHRRLMLGAAFGRMPIMHAPLFTAALTGSSSSALYATSPSAAAFTLSI
jgi:hypothetical protein